MTKKCSICKEIKDISEFAWRNKNKNIKHNVCRDCTREASKNKRKDLNIANPSFIIRNRDLREKGERECKTCGSIKELSMFTGYVARGSQQYFTSCKACELKKQKEWRTNNKDKVKAQREKGRDNKRASYFAKTGRVVPCKCVNYCPALIKINSLINERQNKRNYYLTNRETLIKKSSDYQKHNRNSINLRHKIYRENNSKKVRLYMKDYREANKGKLRIQQKKANKFRWENDIAFRIRHNLSSRTRKAIIDNNGTKNLGTIELLGCDIKFMRMHMKEQFYDRSTGEQMSWDNYGLKGWHIDHIRPCASFDLTDPEQQKICFHYTNLQPLWAEDNLAKSDKLNWVKEA